MDKRNELLNIYLKEISIINEMMNCEKEDKKRNDELMNDLLVNVNAVIDLCYER